MDLSDWFNYSTQRDIEQSAFAEEVAHQFDESVEKFHALMLHDKLLSNPISRFHRDGVFEKLLGFVKPAPDYTRIWLGKAIAKILPDFSERELTVSLLLSGRHGASLPSSQIPHDLGLSIFEFGLLWSLTMSILGSVKPELVAAALLDDVSIVTVVLTGSSDLEVRGPFGMTALLVSVGGASTAVCQILLDHGADPNTRDVFGVSPLLEAVYFGHTAVVNLLLAYGANPDYRTAGQGPLDGSSQKVPHRFNGVWLTQRNVMAKNCMTKKWNAVHLAAHRGLISILDILIKSGVDLSVRDADGLMPLDLAIQNNQDSTVIYLVRQNCPYNSESPVAAQLLAKIFEHVPGISSVRPHESSTDPLQHVPLLCESCSKALRSGKIDSYCMRPYSCNFQGLVHDCHDSALQKPRTLRYGNNEHATYAELTIDCTAEVFHHPVRKISGMCIAIGICQARVLNYCNWNSP
jgi:ankyrin repeat protein